MEPPPSSSSAAATAGPATRHHPPPPPPPGFFTFLKHGVVLPFRNPALFLPLLFLTASLAAALLLGNALSVQPLAAALLLDAAAMSRVDPSTAAYRDLLRTLQSDLRHLLLSLAACLVVAVAAGSAIKIATVFAAVTSFSASSTTTTTISAARSNLWWGPILTVAFGHILELAIAAAIAALGVLAVVLLDYSLLLLFLDALLLLLATLFLVYLAVVCAVAVAVSAAEPGRRGAAAVARAWRLVRGRGAQVVLYVVVICLLGAGVSPVYTLAVRWWAQQSAAAAAAGVAAGVVYVMLLGAVEVFSVVAVTAFYFECRESVEEVEEIMAGHRYVKLPGGSGGSSGDDEANV